MTDKDIHLEMEPRKDSASHLQRQLSVPEASIALKWSNLTAVAPASFSWRQRLCGTEDAPRPKDKVILQNVSGNVKPGQLIAIMGASGAGKSTLLNVLARQNTNRLIVSGDVLVNGKDIGNRIKDISAYVQQEDIFIGTLTVKEHLTFQAMLRMEASFSTAQKLKRVNLVLEDMGLKKCAKTIIGIPGKVKGISGGEKKRLSFASEILTNPPLLFVDEPTSGLDSFMAETVVTVLQGMAKSGRTILCTIHQPSSEIFNMFGSLLLLAEGRTAYLGLRGPATTYFKNLGYICPEDYNPADFYVHTLAIVPGNETECRERVKSLCDSFDANCKSQLEKDNLQDDIDEEDTVDGEFKVSKGKSFKATLWTQLCLLLWRSWLAQIRDPTLVRVKFGQTIFMALLIGLLYLQVSYDARRLQNIAGVIFFVVTNSSLVSLFAVIQTFPMEMPVFLREHGSRLYRTELYFMTKHLSDVPFLIVQTFIYSVIVYWMVGLQDQADKFFTFFGLILLISNVAVGVGYIVSSASSNVSIALALAPVSVIPMMLFGGLFLNVESIPKYFYWVSYLSWFYYGFEALSINEWDGFAAVCSNNTAGCVPDGTTALEFFGFDKANYLQDIAILFALLVAARIVGLLILNLRVYCHDKR